MAVVSEQHHYGYFSLGLKLLELCWQHLGILHSDRPRRVGICFPVDHGALCAINIDRSPVFGKENQKTLSEESDCRETASL